MLQDIDPHKLDNHYRPGQVPGPRDAVLAYSEERVLCRIGENGITFPRVGELLPGPGDTEQMHGDGISFPRAGELSWAGKLTYLFDVDGERYFLADAGETELLEGYSYVPLRSLRRKNAPQRHLIFAAVTGRHLNDWYRTARFCGCCGVRMRHSGTERAMVCPSCGKVFYPRINPAVIVGVTHEDQLLLTRYAGRGLSSYALVAGFAEIGESLEETVTREVMEETGLHVTNIRYYKSQPWGFAADILAGYFCDVTGDTAIHLDTGELGEALWVPRKEIPGQADDFSLTNEMMCAFRDKAAP